MEARLQRILPLAQALNFGSHTPSAIVDAAYETLPASDRRTKEALFASLSVASEPVVLLAIYLLLPDKPPLPCADQLLPTALRLMQQVSGTLLPVRLTLTLVTAIIELETNERTVGQATMKLPAEQVDAVRVAEQSARWPHGVVPKAVLEARALAAKVPHTTPEVLPERREQWQRAWCASNDKGVVAWIGCRFLARLFLAGTRSTPPPPELLARLGFDGEETALPGLQLAALAVVRAVLRLSGQRDPVHAKWLVLQLYEAAALPALLKSVLAAYPNDAVSPLPPPSLLSAQSGSSSVLLANAPLSPPPAISPPPSTPSYVAPALRLLRRVTQHFPSAQRLLVRLRAPVVFRRVIESHPHGAERHAALKLHCTLVPYMGRKWPRMPANAPIVTLFYTELPPRLFSPLAVTAEPDEEGSTAAALSEMEEKALCNRLKLHTTQLALRHDAAHRSAQEAVISGAMREADREIEQVATAWVSKPESAALRASYEVR